MSPRAAWQLERMGFTRVYDFVGGKVEWIVGGLPVEGTGPHYFLAGEIVETNRPTCRPEDAVSEAFRLMDEAGATFCLVTNAEGVLLGRIRANNVDRDASGSVADVMEPGPATVRRVEPLKPLVERMKRAGVKAIPVTDEKGLLLGVVEREKAESFLAGEGPLQRTR